MNKFDEQVFVENIRQLLLERSVERTANQIRSIARKRAKRQRIPLVDVYEDMEENLLSHNPKPERWD